MYWLVFLTVSAVCAGIEFWKFYQKHYAAKEGGGTLDGNSEQPSFYSFQRNYLLVYVLVMGSDWLQGPYIYALYDFYGFSKADIAILFIVGFVSSMIFGTFVGSVADTLGRKKLSIVFSLFYILSCLTKLVNNFWVLLLGRLLSGIATSLLFTVFESWMVHEHHRLRYLESSLTDTFEKSTFLNGVVAVVSGLIASLLADHFGYVSPHLAAIVLLVLAAVVVARFWPENYGQEGAKSIFNLGEALSSMMENPSILIVGSIQSLFEGAMYTFVFMWTPSLLDVSATLPSFGLVFATFMVCIMIGSAVFGLLVRKHEPVVIMQMNLAAATVAFLVAALSTTDVPLYAAFLLFELCCGVYFPCQGTLRSKYIPEQTRSTVMNLFRVPLNFLVVLVLVKVSHFYASTVFFLCAGWVGTALLLSRFIH